MGVLGPGVAGAVAAFVGARQVFFLDAATFLIAAILIATLPGQLKVEQAISEVRTASRTWRDIKDGTTRLFADAPLRYALAMQLVASVTGAQILVNTVGYVQGTLKLSSVQYGWVMGSFGIGATIAAVAVGSLGQRWARTTVILIGATLISIALLPANYAGLGLLMMLWLIAGAGQTCVNVSAQTLIADRTPKSAQGRVYGAQFAWSHLWWAVSYPLAGWLGSQFRESEFLYGSLIGLVLLALVLLILAPKGNEPVPGSLWHEHVHIHDQDHQHDHHPGILVEEPHLHPHQHVANPSTGNSLLLT